MKKLALLLKEVFFNRYDVMIFTQFNWSGFKILNASTAEKADTKGKEK